MNRLCLRASLAAMLMSLALCFVAPAMAQQTTGPGARPNPTAEAVSEEALFKQESRIGGRVTIPDERAANLIQPQGREWREWHEVTLPWIAGIAIVGMLLLLAVFYLVFGRVRAEFSRSGRRILRFGGFERFTHWFVATSFIILALSGLNYIFGKRLIMPLIGPQNFGELSQWSKYAHDFFAWPFTLGVLAMIVLWIKDNLPTRVDWIWLKSGGGLTGKSHASAGRFNAGQKLVFWGVTLGGIAMFLSGLTLIFPFTIGGVNDMQLTSGVHALIGGLFIAGILAHIYIGTLGMEGAFEAMGSGTVDIGWARQHHDLWVEGYDNPSTVDPKDEQPRAAAPQQT